MKGVIKIILFLFLMVLSSNAILGSNVLEKAISTGVSDPAVFCPSSTFKISLFGLPDQFGFLYLSALAMFTSFLISMFLYLFAKITGHPAASSIIYLKINDLGTLLFILLGFGAIYSTLYIPNNSLIRNYHDYAFEFNGNLISKIVSVYPTMFLINSMYYAFYNYQMPLAVGRNNLFGFHLNIGPVFKPLIDVATTLSTYLGIILGEFIGKQYFLCFIRLSILPYLFPLGVFLRSFNATKGAGATLIAIAISFFVVYPAMLSLNYAIYNIKTLHYFNAGLSSTQSAEKLNTILGIGTVGGAMFGGVKLLYLLKNYNLATSFLFLSKSFVTAMLMGIAIITFNSILNMYIEITNIMFIYGFILPAINIFITLNVARELARAMSIDLDLSAFMRVI